MILRYNLLMRSLLLRLFFDRQVRLRLILLIHHVVALNLVTIEQSIVVSVALHRCVIKCIYV